MVRPKKLGTVTRMNFAKLDDVLEMPDLIEVQKKSYKWFLDEGLREVLADVSPITDYSGNLSIELVDYSLDAKPKFSEEECKERDVNYAAPLRVTVRLYNKNTGEVIEREIFMGDFPLMTHNGTFIINGAERVIVSQIVRSPGMYYSFEMDKSGNKLLGSTVIPYRGAWLEYETDANNVFYVRIDKTRKIPITVLIRALGVETDAEVKAMFGEEAKLMATLEKDGMNAAALESKRTPGEEALKEIYKKLRPGEPPLVESAVMLINNMFFDPKRYDLANVGRYKFNKKTGIAQRLAGNTLTRPAISMVTGEVVLEAGAKVNYEQALAAEKAGVNEVFVALENGEEFKIFSNSTVYPETVLGFDLSAAGISGKVCYKALVDIVENAGGDVDEIIRSAKEH
ncbi:MAG: DNA-directed RNA polymerase subunit beta, partial [Clostridia bacterium]|nr:DNA-directed RNA polymerase subunit beta [Clostridia bacterium]